MTEFDAKSFLKTLPSRPGVYRMFDAEGQALYVGKAKNLKNRVSSYFRTTALDSKTMVADPAGRARRRGKTLITRRRPCHGGKVWDGGATTHGRTSRCTLNM